jgi:rhodanese-related sulfurtransferase
VKKTVPHLRTIVICIASIACLAAANAQSVQWALVNWKVRHDFPDVRRIDSTQLAQWLNDRHREQPVLLDVRTKAEYDVSHINKAQRIEPGADAGGVTLPRDRPIVTYCSVGYRSAAFAKKLQEAGFKNVQNMSDSIFEWANKGYAIERKGQPAHKVHPYNERWGKLLKKELRADVPPVGNDM